MPSTIPYDSSLVLGSIVDKKKLDLVVKIAELQAPADTAQNDLNSLITLKRSIDMTIQEMIDMGIDVSELRLESSIINEQVQKAAVGYGAAKMAAEKAIQPLCASMAAVNKEIESPIDYNRSQLKKMPISSDSMQMNVQYFSFDEDSQSSNSHASAVSSFVSESLSYFGSKESYQASASVQRQVNSQTSRHSISGTLVICITCTHKNAQVFAPFILDVDKAVHAWNKLFPDDMIKTNDPMSIMATQSKEETLAERSFSILSGATYGSSFVGMVHVLNTTRTSTSQSMESITASLQETFQEGRQFAAASGGFGVVTSLFNSAKNLLSAQNIQSHCSLVTIPANAARTGQQMAELKNSTIKSALSGLAEVDDGKNKIIDINSMMTAMDEYVNRCVTGDNLGVPVNYYLKPITKSMITRAWLAKYYPNNFNKAGSADDSGSK
jgi:hypothetical protein